MKKTLLLVSLCVASVFSNELFASDFCQSNIDCEGSSHCIDRGDGIHVCTRNTKNAFCESHIDCPSGSWCKDRGDGMKVCM